MSDRRLRLQVVLGAVDKLTRPFQGASAANKRLAETLKESRKQLGELNQKTSQIDGFRKIKKQLAETQQAYRAANDRVTGLARAMKGLDNPTKAQIQQFERAKNAAAKLKTKNQDLSISLQRQRDALAKSGISVKRLADAQRQLNGDVKRANSTIDQQSEKLKRLKEREKRLSAAKFRYHNVKNVQGSMLASAASMGATGGGLLMGVKPMLNEASIYHKEMAEFRALGVGENILKDADKFANGMTIIGNSTSDNLKILKEAHSVLRHYDEAKMVTPELLKLQYATRFLGMHGISDEKAQEMRDQSQEVLKIAELRNMINSPEDFKKSVNLSAQAMAASGGLVLPSDYMAMLKTGNVAAKQMSDEAFYFSMSHIIQQIGGDRTGTSLASAYQNLMMGRTTQGAAEELNALGLLQKGAVKYGKTGHITKVKPGALVNAEQFQADPFRYLMEEIVPRIRKKHPQLDERGMETAIAKLFSNRKGADLFVTMYREHANIEKQIKAGHEAYSVDQLVKEGKTTAQGQELERDARMRDLYKEIGGHLLPLYIKGLSKLSEMLGNVKTFFQAHPTMSKYLSIAAAGLGIILAICGALTLVLATLLGPLAMVRLGFSVLGIKGSGSLKLLGGAFKILAGVIRGTAAFLWANPIILIIAAIAGAAVLIYVYWDKLGPWFKKLWQTICGYFSAGWQYISTTWEQVKQDTQQKWAGIKKAIADKWNEIVEDTKKLPEKFKQFGTEIIDKLINGIKEKWKALKQSIANLGTELKDAITPDFMKTQAAKPDVKQALEAYHNTNNAGFFGAFDRGGAIPAGKFGLVGEHGPELINGPVRVTSRRQTAALASMAAAALSMGVSTVSAQPAPLHPYSLPAAQYQNAGLTVNHSTQHNDRPAYEIHIHPTPAQSAQDIAQAVARELDRREQQRRARARSAFADREEF